MRAPLGVFEHSLDNPDFRAEGTRNEFGICGCGRKVVRVYDFGLPLPTRVGAGRDTARAMPWTAMQTRQRE
jgi:hypothetical protein